MHKLDRGFCTGLTSPRKCPYHKLAALRVLLQALLQRWENCRAGSTSSSSCPTVKTSSTGLLLPARNTIRLWFRVSFSVFGSVVSCMIRGRIKYLIETIVSARCSRDNERQTIMRIFAKSGVRKCQSFWVVAVHFVVSKMLVETQI